MVTCVVLVMVDVRTMLLVVVFAGELEEPVTAPAEDPAGTDDVVGGTKLDVVGDVTTELLPTVAVLDPEAAGTGLLGATVEVVRVEEVLIVTVKVPVRVIVCITEEVVPAGELPVTAPAVELLGIVGTTPLETVPLPEAAGGGRPLVPTEVRVSGQTVVETGTTEVTTEVSGQLVTEDAQL